MSLFKKKDPTAPEAPADEIKVDGSAAFGEFETVSAAEVDEVMKKYDRESNTRIWTGVPKRVIQFIMALFSLYCIYSTLWSNASLEVRLMIFLGCVTIMGFLYYPMSKHHVRENYIPWFDWIIMIVGAACFFYYAFNFDAIIKVLTSASKMTPALTVIGIVGILSLVELCRRCVGIPILCVAGALLVYTFWSMLSKGMDLERVLGRVIYTLFYGTGGVIGTPINVCAKFIVVFIVFGAFLERTGIAKFFIDLANKVAGASSGGPAKVAVISSALCGMVSGSSVGNTVTTGSVTIPMMKKTGYKPEFAGAVEAAASTGGQIMPPIMGAAAFLMAEYVGISYGEIALKAILPAFLYFAGIFIAVHLEAKKLGLKGLSRSEMVPGKELAVKSYLLIPIVLLVVLVSLNVYTMQKAAALSIIAAIVVGVINKDSRLTPAKFLEALEAGGKGTITVAVACAMAGIIAGCITVTGLASKLITAIVALSGNTLIIGLFLTMICCIILGMGVPTTANYCIMAATCAPILEKLGVPTVAAHFFVFYFGIVADITPPVALAAYAGSAIAKSNPMKTGINATKLAIAAFIVPYVFAYSPSMLFVDVESWVDIVTICLSAMLGIYGVAAGLNGFVKRKLNWLFRILFIVGGLTLIIPGWKTDAIGLILVGGITAYEFIMAKKEQNEAMA